MEDKDVFSIPIAAMKEFAAIFEKYAKSLEGQTGAWDKIRGEIDKAKKGSSSDFASGMKRANRSAQGLVETFKTLNKIVTNLNENLYALASASKASAGVSAAVKDAADVKKSAHESLKDALKGRSSKLPDEKKYASETVSALDKTSGAIKNQTRQWNILGKAKHGLEKLSRGGRGLESGVGRFASGVGRVASGVGRFASALGRIGGGILRSFGVVGGMIGMAGGAAFSILSALAGAGLRGFGTAGIASTALSQDREARANSSSIGSMQSWKANLGPFAGTGLLQSAANAKIDYSLLGPLSVLLGARNTANIKNQSPGEISIAVLNAVHRAYQQNPHTQSAAFAAFQQFGGSVSEWQAIGNARPQDLERAEKKYRQDISKVGYGAGDAEKWRNLWSQLQVSEQQVLASFLKSLGDVTPLLSKFSSYIAGLLSSGLESGAFQKAIQSVVDYFTSSDFTKLEEQLKTNITDLSDGISAVSSAIKIFKGVVSAANAPFSEGVYENAKIAKRMILNAGTLWNNTKKAISIIGLGIYDKLNGTHFVARDFYSRVLPYKGALADANKKHNLPEGYLFGLITRESSFIKTRYNVKSGATGIAQFLPNVARSMHFDPHDPFASIDKAGELLERYYKKYKDRDKAIAAYNYGPGNLDAVLKKAKSANRNWFDFLPDETKKEVNFVKGFYSNDNGIIFRSTKDAIAAIKKQGEMASKSNGMAYTPLAHSMDKLSIEVHNNAGGRLSIGAQSATTRWVAH